MPALKGGRAAQRRSWTELSSELTARTHFLRTASHASGSHATGVGQHRETPAAPRAVEIPVLPADGMRRVFVTRATCRRAIGALLVTAFVLVPRAAAADSPRVRDVHSDPAAFSKTAAQMRLKLKAVAQSQDNALSKAEQLLSSPINEASSPKAPPTPEFLKEKHGGLDFVHGTKLVGTMLKHRQGNRFDRAVDRRIARARMGREEDERINLHNGPESREWEVNRRELVQERRDRSSERNGARLGSEQRALEEAAAFARLTAGARDPRAAAKKRLAQKSEKESYERASNEGMIWKEINQMKHHAEDDTVRVDKSDGLNGEVRELANLSPPKAAKVLAKMSQTDGSAALGALKSIDPQQVKRILDALGEEQHEAAHKGGAAGRNADGDAGARESKAEGHGRSHMEGKGHGKRALVPKAPEFDIHSVHRFDPGESLSFAGGTAGGTFSLTYADRSVLTGYVCKDIVQLGHYYAMTRFGCALDCNDPQFDGIDGILGMGLPDAALANIPTPLFFAISHDRGGIEGSNYINEHPLHTRKFAFLSDSISGELQLGGYDRESTAADMVYVRATSTTEYSVNVQSLTFGGIELLDWVDKTVPNAVPAIMDTGTTCLVIPDTILGGRVSDKPYSKFKSIMTKGMSFYITIDGHLFEIPYMYWWNRITQAPCVQQTPSSYAGILLGDVVFQSLVVEFDLTKPKAPLIGIAPRNPLYHLVTPGGQDRLKMPMIKRHRGQVEIVEPESESESRYALAAVLLLFFFPRHWLLPFVPVPRHWLLPFSSLGTGSCLSYFFPRPWLLPFVSLRNIGLFVLPCWLPCGAVGLTPCDRADTALITCQCRSIACEQSTL
jgi:hypothetical protein